MKVKFSGNKIGIVAMALLLGISVPVCTYAAGTGRKSNLKSEGIIDYTDGTHSVCIDSRDLYYLADEIDAVEETAKLGTLQAIQDLPDAAGAAGLSGKTAADIKNITFSQLNEAIKESQTSAAAPSAAEILSGKVVWANGKKYTGTMINNGATGKSNLMAGSSYTIPAGYTTGGTVTTATLASQTSATAVAANLSSGATAWVNGVKITGTMVNNGAVGKSNMTAGSSYTIPAGYTTGGTVTTASLASQTAGTATAANLSQGVTAWVNGVMITGTGEDNNSYYNQGIQNAVIQKVLIGEWETNYDNHGTSIRSFDCTSITGWQNLTTDNFSFEYTGGFLNWEMFDAYSEEQQVITANCTFEYDNEYGIVTISYPPIGIQLGSGVYSWFFPSGKVYCYTIN